MKLRKWNWDAQRFDEIEYADEPIKRFLDWMAESKSWHDNVELVHQRFRKMNAELEIARSGARVMDAEDEIPAVQLPVHGSGLTKATHVAVKKSAKVKRPATPAQIAALAKGRAALEAKRAAKVAP
jgi:hypothetical protein